MVWKGQHPELVVEHLLEGHSGVVLYRILASETPSATDFTSAFVLGHPPPRRLQKQSAPVWMALSMLSRLDAAPQRVRLFPRLGDHVARLELAAGEGFAVAETIEAGHFSVWGRSGQVAGYGDRGLPCELGMYYVLLDSHGASLDTFDEREPALRAWQALIRQDAAAAEDVALLLCGDDGVAVESVSVDAALAA